MDANRSTDRLFRDPVTRKNFGLTFSRSTSVASHRWDNERLSPQPPQGTDGFAKDQRVYG